MKIEFDADEVKAIILEYARKFNPELNRVQGCDYRGIPGVAVSFEKPIDMDAEQAALNAELGLPA